MEKSDFYKGIDLKDLWLPNHSCPYVLYVWPSPPTGLPFRSLEEILTFLVENAQVDISLSGRFHIVPTKVDVDKPF